MSIKIGDVVKLNEYYFNSRFFFEHHKNKLANKRYLVKDTFARGIVVDVVDMDDETDKQSYNYVYLDIDVELTRKLKIKQLIGND